MTYHIFKEIPGVGLRYLGSPEQPYRWVKDTRNAYEFSSPTDLAEELNAQVVEVDDPWAGPGGR